MYNDELARIPWNHREMTNYAREVDQYLNQGIMAQNARFNHPESHVGLSPDIHHGHYRTPGTYPNLSRGRYIYAIQLGLEGTTTWDQLWYRNQPVGDFNYTDATVGRMYRGRGVAPNIKYIPTLR